MGIAMVTMGGIVLATVIGMVVKEFYCPRAIGTQAIMVERAAAVESKEKQKRLRSRSGNNLEFPTSPKSDVGSSNDWNPAARLPSPAVKRVSQRLSLNS